MREDLRQAAALLGELATPQPWEHSREGLDDGCHFCGSTHDDYDRTPRYHHFIDCQWLEAMSYLGREHPDHGVFIPAPPDPPCEICGWQYLDEDEWRGRELPPISDVPFERHEEHLAAEAGMTVEEWRNRPIRISDLLPDFKAPRGGILFFAPPAIPGIKESTDE